jgi:hypothetical protein
MEQDQPKAGQRAKTLADVPMRFPPPPGTRFYVCFRANEYVECPPYSEMLTVVANHPQDAIEQILRSGKRPADRRLRYVTAIWFNHNRRARVWGGWLGPDDDAGTI